MLAFGCAGASAGLKGFGPLVAGMGVIFESLCGFDSRHARLGSRSFFRCSTHGRIVGDLGGLRRRVKEACFSNFAVLRSREGPRWARKIGGGKFVGYQVTCQLAKTAKSGRNCR